MFSRNKKGRPFPNIRLYKAVSLIPHSKLVIPAFRNNFSHYIMVTPQSLNVVSTKQTVFSHTNSVTFYSSKTFSRYKYIAPRNLTVTSHYLTVVPVLFNLFSKIKR